MTHKSDRKKLFSFFLVFVFSLFIFSYYQYTTPHIIGNDGYYHIKAAALIKERLQLAPDWWAYSILNDFDIHFLFHILLIPFTFLGLTTGTKVAAIFFASLLPLTMYYLLQYYKVKYRLVWIALFFCASYSPLFRLTFTRPFALACVLFLLAYHFIYQKQYKILFVTAFIYTWLHSSFPFLLVLGSAYTVVRYFKSKKILISHFLPLIGGIVGGLVINPFFPKNLHGVFVQIFSAFLFPSSEIVRPTETGPFQSWWIFILVFRILLLFMVLVLFIVLKKRSRLKEVRDHTLIFFLLFLVLSYFLSTAIRFMEWWTPLTILFLAFLTNDLLQHEKILRIQQVRIPFSFIIVALMIPLISFTSSQVVQNIDINIQTKRNYDFVNCATWLQENTPPSSLVYVGWSTFAPVFFTNDHNRYIVGLDPTFLYAYDRDLYLKYLELKEGRSDDPYNTITQDFKTEVILISNANSDFNRLLRTQSNFSIAYQDETCSVYQL